MGGHRSFHSFAQGTLLGQQISFGITWIKTETEFDGQAFIDFFCTLLSNQQFSSSAASHLQVTAAAKLREFY
jgi:hypothetical protein